MGAAGLSKVSTFPRTLSASAVGAATLTATATFLKTLASTVTGAATLATQFIAGGTTFFQTLAHSVTGVASLVALFIAGEGTLLTLTCDMRRYNSGTVTPDFKVGDYPTVRRILTRFGIHFPEGSNIGRIIDPVSFRDAKIRGEISRRFNNYFTKKPNIQSTTEAFKLVLTILE